MDTVKVRRIGCRQRELLHRMKRQRSNRVNSLHARIILLSAGRVRNRDIAERVDCTPRWVREIIHRFQRGGVDAITWYPYGQAPSRPRMFFAEIVEQIAEVALSSAQALIGMTHWSLSKLREYLVNEKIVGHIRLEWLRELLVRYEIKWRHTKTWKESKDPEFRTKYRRLRRLYAHRPADGHRLCIDEFGPLNLLPRHGRCFARKGRKPVERHRATYHRTKGVRYFLAAYDLETGRMFGTFREHKTAHDWLGFLKWLRRRYRSRDRLHLVMDNYSSHLTQEIRQWAATHRVTFYLTPTNASWLNRIESQFTAVKEFALNNSDYRSHEEQEAAIRRYLTWRNGSRKIAMESWRSHIRRTRDSNTLATQTEKTRK